ncbi:unnamed protein product [marine sediment metagenome]|uniref:Uncharacterized protein n=1 Tax=marine sediment metagenome TaxID=412755 RepID=X1F7G8_9ZZZZ
MKLTTLGIILALKNLGTWLATMSFTNVRDDPGLFLWLFLIYVLINVPSDLFIMNHATKTKD